VHNRDSRLDLCGFKSVVSLHEQVNQFNAIAPGTHPGVVLTAAASRAAGADEALGGRIRAVRARRELSVAELATRAGVSKSLVSQIERGIAAPSIETVRRLASVLQVPVFSLFLDEPADGMVVRRAERRVVRYPGSGATREILSPTLSGRMVMLWVTFPPGESGREPVRHVGEEGVVVIQGALEVQIGEQSMRLEAGDSMTFDPDAPHAFRNLSDSVTEIVTVLAPPNI
jgi:transcriptional regulator with XRE-family HTH domain